MLFWPAGVWGCQFIVPSGSGWFGVVNFLLFCWSCSFCFAWFLRWGRSFLLTSFWGLRWVVLFPLLKLKTFVRTTRLVRYSILLPLKIASGTTPILSTLSFKLPLRRVTLWDDCFRLWVAGCVGSSSALVKVLVGSWCWVVSCLRSVFVLFIRVIAGYFNWYVQPFAKLL